MPSLCKTAPYYTGCPADIFLVQDFAEHLASYNSGTTLIHAPKFLGWNFALSCHSGFLYATIVASPTAMIFFTFDSWFFVPQFWYVIIIFFGQLWLRQISLKKRYRKKKALGFTASETHKREMNCSPRLHLWKGLLILERLPYILRIASFDIIYNKYFSFVFMFWTYKPKLMLV